MSNSEGEAEMSSISTSGRSRLTFWLKWGSLSRRVKGFRPWEFAVTSKSDVMAPEMSLRIVWD
jgi:hypothetical protein